MTNPSPYLTTNELAERWSISPGTLRKWRWLAVGPAYVKLGDARNAEVRYHIDDVKQYEEGNTYAPAE
jgi:hypothetical protein